MNQDNLIFTEQSFTNPDHDIPVFVLQKVRSILDRWYVDEDQTEENFYYTETKGCITDPYKDGSKHILVGIAGNDHIIQLIYPGASSAWVEANSHCLSFQEVPAHQLPPLHERDPFTWWIISVSEEAAWPKVIRIHIIPEEQMASSFPEL